MHFKFECRENGYAINLTMLFSTAFKADFFSTNIHFQNINVRTKFNEWHVFPRNSNTLLIFRMNILQARSRRNSHKLIRK